MGMFLALVGHTAIFDEALQAVGPRLPRRNERAAATTPWPNASLSSTALLEPGESAAAQRSVRLNCSFLTSSPHAWYNRLPVFTSLSALHASEWYDYMVKTYGPDLRFPIDMRCFAFFHVRLLPPRWKHEFASRFKPDNSTVFNDGDVVTFYGSMAHVNIYRYAHTRPGLDNVRAFHSNERIEVFHYASDCRSDAGRNRIPVGYWMMFSPGSGIFFDLGKTLAFDDGYDAACRYFHGPHDLCDKCCTPVHAFIIQAARKHGIDSIQVRGSRPGGRKLRRFELFSTRSDCDAHEEVDNGACPLPGVLSHLNNTLCHCNSTQIRHMNCNGS